MLYNWLVVYKRLASLYKKYLVFFLQTRVKLFIVPNLSNQFIFKKKPLYILELEANCLRFYFANLFNFSFLVFIFYKDTLDYKKHWTIFWAKLFNFKYIRNFLLGFNYLVTTNRRIINLLSFNPLNPLTVQPLVWHSIKWVISKKNFYKQRKLMNYSTPAYVEKNVDENFKFIKFIEYCLFSQLMSIFVELYKSVIIMLQFFIF